MSMTWEDAQREAYYDQQLEELEKEIAKRRIDTVAYFISEGFTSSENITYSLSEELKVLDFDRHSRAVCLLNCTLLETIERETICLPLLVSGLGVEETEPKKVDQIKKLVSIDPPKFAFRYFEDGQSDVGKVKNHFDAMVSSIAPGNETFRTESNLWMYRERVQGFRNYLVHGRGVSGHVEAKYVDAFSKAWKELIYNSILSKFGLYLDASWHLRDLK